MAAPSVTYSFTNDTTADATEVNQNFSDIINGITDGTEDLTISALTVNGAGTFNGAVTLGNATGDDITITGYVASSILPKTSAASDLGSSAQNWQSLFLDNGATDGGAVYFNAGTTAFLKADAAGAVLDVGGFTSFDLNVTADVVGGKHVYCAVNTGTVYDEGDPPYSFTGDTDTGMFSESADRIDFATGGTRALFIDSSQDVTGLGHIYAPVNTGSIFDEGDPAYSFTGDTDTGMYQESANVLGFATGGVNRTTIAADGKHTLVSTDQTLIVQSSGTGGGTSMSDWSFTASADPTGFFYHRYQRSGASDIGSVKASGASAVAFNTSSDGRLKKGKKKLKNAIDIMKKFKSIFFNWKSDDKLDCGFVAQEVYKAYPYPVSPPYSATGEIDAEFKEEDEAPQIPWSMDYGKFAPLFHSAILENNRTIEDLKARIETLEAS
jgi:hypothetical protein